MRSVALAGALMLVSIGQALAWGQEGHSIIAEIAQRRLSPDAAAMVEQVLGKGRSLASIASWADDAREHRPSTTNWHFVDIPLEENKYEPARDCNVDPTKGDCIVAELDRLRNALRCASDGEKVEALKFAVHFVGDIHQPLHTIREDEGANLILVDLFTHGKTCTGSCVPSHTRMKYHAAWDTGLIEKTVWDWGNYVERLETDWLSGPEARQVEAEHTTIVDWAEETHRAAQKVWNALPRDNVLDDNYYNLVLPILDRQLAVGGLRLARFLNEAYASKECPAR
jgi:S1/P1 Nuclease